MCIVGLLNHGRSRDPGFAAHIELLLVLGLRPALGAANPLGRRQSNGDSSSSVSPKIWIPVLLAVLVLSGAAMMKWSRRTLSRGLASMGEAAAIASGTPIQPSTTPVAREVTAEQLAGQTGARRTGRRARRTPSQISTKSLPVYMKEPGEQELVIFRGEDPEDEPEVATTVIMPPVVEDAEGQTRASLYGNLPDSPQDMSLIHGDESFDPATDTSTRHLIPPTSRQSALRGSFDTLHGSEESASSLLRAVQQAGNDPRGEAPPYFEVVDNGNIAGLRQGMSSAEPTSQPLEFPQSTTADTRAATSPQIRGNRNSHRLSGFRSMLHTLTNSNVRPIIPPIPQEPPQNSLGHNRADSGLSVTLLTTQEMHQARERGASRASHRPSHSGSGSMMQTALRTISRQKSHHTLNSGHFNSPSMISLNSISAPLTHTLTRTEISYPASGPTADQMRLISSRESFVRFGKPYGPDAIAYAASTSRHDLEPPPDFESHVSPPAAVARSSPLAGLRRDTSELPPEARPASPDSSSSQSLQEGPVQEVELAKDTDQNPEQPSDDRQSSPMKRSPSPLRSVERSAPAPILPTTPMVQDVPAKATSATPASPPPSPSAFKASPVYAPPMRPESRASSMASAISYATADEYIYDSAPSRAHTPESPSIPQRPLFQTHENTDVTISQRMAPVTAQIVA